jgi:hypothetical protein
MTSRGRQHVAKSGEKESKFSLCLTVQDVPSHDSDAAETLKTKSGAPQSASVTARAVGSPGVVAAPLARPPPHIARGRQHSALTHPDNGHVMLTASELNTVLELQENAVSNPSTSPQWRERVGCEIPMAEGDEVNTALQHVSKSARNNPFPPPGITTHRGPTHNSPTAEMLRS